jgi:glucosylceramidase
MKVARVPTPGLCLALLLTIAGCAGSVSSGKTGTAGTTGGPGTGGSGIVCAGGRALCGSECVDTTADTSNCGGCGIPCATGQICQGRQCQCQSGLMDCNGSCVASDGNHCGSCTNVCSATEVCLNGVCATDCVEQTVCGTACIDLSLSDANCGRCGHACNAGQVCVGGNCGDSSATGAAGTSGNAGASGGNPGSGGNAGSTGSGATTGTSGSVGTGRGGTTGTGGSSPTMLLVTSAPNAYWNTSGTLSVVTTGTAEVTVNDASTMQTWEGFGGSFNEMGWSYLLMLSQADRDKALQLLYGADGARFAFGRIPIGASDYAMSRYTLDEASSGTDPTLASFAITGDMDKLIPYIKAAQAVKGNIRFWGSPWTPPTWMKSSPYQSGNVVSPFDGGTMKSDDATMKAFAQYLIKWVQAYQGQGITVEAIAPQNEPNFGQNYPSCLWGTSTYVTFIGKYLGPAITTAGISTKIMLGTMSNDASGKDPSIMTGVMADATAKPYIKVLGLQWGMQSQLATARSYNLPLWQTEHKCGNYPWNPSGSPTYKATAPNDQAYAVESWGLIRDWIKGGVTAYSAWNMVLDTVGKGIDTTRDWAQNALLTVNTSSKTLALTPTYHVFRHFSQFVDPGAKVVATSGGDAIAFRNPNGSIVTVMYNAGAAKTTIVSASGKRFQFSMPGSGWATVVSQ